MEQSITAVECELVDLAGVSLDALRSLDSTLLAASLAELLHRIDQPQASVGGGHNGGAAHVD